MSFVQELEAKFAGLKDKAEDDLHALVLKLEAIFHRVHQAQLAEGLKQALSADIHAAVSHAEVVAGGLQSDVKKAASGAVKVVEEAVEAETSTRTSRRK
jgi:ElaB/YqjD/DUF883 family membrane-anchored ribosome-binding protein